MKTYFALFLILLSACTTDPTLETEVGSAQSQLDDGQLVQFLSGRDTFLHETFEGNGRVCSTCHLRRFIGDNFDFTPTDAQTIFASDPTNPLFRALDSDDGAGLDYTTLLNLGLVRIDFGLPPNVTVDERNRFAVEDPTTGAVTVFVLRSTPSIENNALLRPFLMWDGRFDDFPVQATGAVNTHFEAGRVPTAEEGENLGVYQSQFFTNPSLRLYAAGGPAPGLPAVPAILTGEQWDSVRRGRNFFVSMPVTPENPVRGGHCATCHSGPMLNTTNEFNPVQVAGQNIGNNFVSEFSSLPALTYHVTLQHPVVMPDVPLAGTILPPAGTPLFPPGLVFTIHSSDPGRVLHTGDPCEVPLTCLLGSNPQTGQLGTVSLFRISSLWGTADTAPYFHDNSAGDLASVVSHYNNTVFALTAINTGNPAWFLSPQEQTDIVAYMNYAFRRTTPL